MRKHHAHIRFHHAAAPDDCSGLEVVTYMLAVYRLRSGRSLITCQRRYNRLLISVTFFLPRGPMVEHRPPAMFLADSLGLDFLNSVATPIDTPVDWLDDGDGLL